MNNMEPVHKLKNLNLLSKENYGIHVRKSPTPQAGRLCCTINCTCKIFLTFTFTMLSLVLAPQLNNICYCSHKLPTETLFSI